VRTIELKEFYKALEKNEFRKVIFFEKPDSEGGLFEIIKTLGRGGNGCVFLALDKNKLFALRMSYEKSEFEGKIQSLKKEFGGDYKEYLLELIHTSHHITYFLRGKEKEKIFFDKDVFMSVWEQADATLGDKLEERFEDKLKWFNQFLKSLSVIHSRERMHLDIKLSNLFIVDDKLKIGDVEFYLKKEDFIKNGPKVYGTPGYIAPELFYDTENVSTQCDIFSAGVTFCEFFTGSETSIDLPQKKNGLSSEDQDELKNLFGDKPLSIRGKRILELFIKNFRIFNFFKKQLKKKLESGGTYEKERKIYELILTMVEIDPGARPDIDRLLFKIHEIEFDPESLIGQKLLGTYTVQELIDEGGRGIVYKVWDSLEKVSKAIKLFPQQFSFIKDGFDQIRNELLLTRDINHRNVVRVFALGREGDLNFISMEYIIGFTLKKKLDEARGKKLKEIEALSIMKQVASGLIEAHRNGVIHRNLKDKNIMIRADDKVVKIINFGLSLKIKKSIAETTGEAPMGRETLLVAPPEQLQEEILKEENEQTDVWGFGVILYQLLTGKIPSKSDLKKIEENRFPIAGISKETRYVIMKCLENDRLRRYRNMEEVYDALSGEHPPLNDQEPGYEELSKKISEFFQRFKKKWVLGLIFGLIASALLIILGTNIISGGERYEMWYSGKPGDAETPGGGVGYAVSSNGIKWKRYKNNPVIPHGNPGSFNEFESSQPFVVHDGKDYHILFSGSIKKVEGLEYQIGLTNVRGLIQGNDSRLKKVILDNGKIKFPGPLLYIDGYFKMWFSENGEIYYACTKTKGLSITDMVRHGDSPVLSRGNDGEWDEVSVITGSILYESGIYRMWYTGKAGEESKIGYATSGDGITWNKYHDNPIFDDKDITLERNPFVIHDSKGYKMYYTAATTGSEYYPVRLATSTDGINWEKHPNIPVFDTGSDDWEKSKIFVTTVTVEKK
jgi:serine/threonine protein kinase